MANPACMVPDCQVAATFTGTFFETGQSITVCVDHFVEFAAGTLQAMTGAEVLAFLAAGPNDGDVAVILDDTKDGDDEPIGLSGNGFDVYLAQFRLDNDGHDPDCFDDDGDLIDDTHTHALTNN